MPLSLLHSPPLGSGESCAVLGMQDKEGIISATPGSMNDLEELLQELITEKHNLQDIWEALNTHRTSMGKRLGYEVDASVAILDWLHQKGLGNQLRLMTEHQYVTLMNASSRDIMTGLYNHRAFRDQLELELREAKKEGYSVSLLLIDLDNFKAFNDRYGHLVGDSILNGTARLILSCLREKDFPCRYGGDEFAVILPKAAQSEAIQIAERIRQNIVNASHLTPSDAADLPRLTASIGVATVPETAETATELVGHADQACYQAKRLGKNRVVVFNVQEKHLYQERRKKA